VNYDVVCELKRARTGGRTDGITSFYSVI